MYPNIVSIFVNFCRGRWPRSESAKTPGLQPARPRACTHAHHRAMCSLGTPCHPLHTTKSACIEQSGTQPFIQLKNHGLPPLTGQPKGSRSGSKCWLLLKSLDFSKAPPIFFARFETATAKVLQINPPTPPNRPGLETGFVQALTLWLLRHNIVPFGPARCGAGHHGCLANP